MRYGGDSRSRLLLVTLIVTSLFLITLDLRGVKLLDGIRSGTQSAMAPFQRAGSAAVSPFKNFFTDVTHLGRTRKQIQNLRAENSRLRTQLRLRIAADGQLKQLKSVLDLVGAAHYKSVSAKVISQGAATSFTQSIVIDAGSTSGITKNMTVVSGDGLVGVVKTAYSHSALVMLATDPSFKIGARIAGTQQIGILSGQGSRQAVLQLLDNRTIVKKGDILLSRGSLNNRPFVPGLPIGVVTDTDNGASSVAQSATVKLFPNFSALGVVNVIVSTTGADPRDALVPRAPVPVPVPTVTIYATPGATPAPTPTKSK